MHWQNLKDKTPREDKAHIKFVKQLPCIVCIAEHMRQYTQTVPHHLRRLANNGRGTSLKARDCKVVPLCVTHHTGAGYIRSGFDDFVHKTGDEIAYFERHGILNVEDLADALYESSGEFAECEDIIQNWRTI